MKRLPRLLLSGGLAVALASCTTALPAAAAAPVPPGVRGLDVSSHQPGVSWPAVYRDGARFAYVKATESTTYRNPRYAEQYQGARQAGLIRGAYHFALPHKSGGAAQADYFFRNGGGWTSDGWTLPGVLDIEFNPYQSSNGLDICYGLSPARMVSWIRDFSDRYLALAGRRPAVYTNTYWWQTCTGGSAAFGDHPLWLARYASAVGALPAGWTTHAIWQHADSGVFPGDQNVFNGTYEQLKLLAAGRSAAAPVKAPVNVPVDASPKVSVKAPARKPTRAATRVSSLNAGPEPAGKGRKLTVSGTLRLATGTRRAVAGQRVLIRFRPRGSTVWRTAGTAVTASGGTFRRTFRAAGDGTWQAVYNGDALRLAARSGSDYVDVRTGRWW
ncbi:lysozyme [Planomonospora sphaerica]|uniref:Lysozyme n=1 Tax=Planomonospora sphaerica TaxID=161355 RepID=A0A171DHA7_9ACTN|nr:lysozyme [Planomonospora sphaerica]GAT68478.1 lysozyme [Planomonospora sphaerica]